MPIPIYTSYFMLLSRNVMGYIILGAMKYLSLSLLDNAFVYWNRSLAGEKISPESINYCCNLRFLP